LSIHGEQKRIRAHHYCFKLSIASTAPIPGRINTESDIGVVWQWQLVETLFKKAAPETMFEMEGQWLACSCLSRRTYPQFLK
jgi:hypothetical protein